MIERLLAAERALGDGDLLLAERLFQQVADADPRNAIAIVGLARVAEARNERDEARRLVDRALEVDPDEAVARRLRDALTTAPAPQVTPPAEPVTAAAHRAAPASPTPSSAPAASELAPEPVASELAPQPTGSELAPQPTATPIRRSGLIAWFRRLLRLDP